MQPHERPTWFVIVGLKPTVLRRSTRVLPLSLNSSHCTADFDNSLEKRALKLSSEAVVVFLVVFISLVGVGWALGRNWYVK